MVKIRKLLNLLESFFSKFTNVIDGVIDQDIKDKDVLTNKGTAFDHVCASGGNGFCIVCGKPIPVPNIETL